MKLIKLMIAVAGIAVGLSAPASAAQSDPEIIIYRFPGVLDSGGPTNVGAATSFHCTNFSTTAETLRIVVRNNGGAILSNVSSPILQLETVTFSTHNTVLYSEINLNTGAVSQGTAGIAATSINIVCTAVTLDAATPQPLGFALVGLRFPPASRNQHQQAVQ